MCVCVNEVTVCACVCVCAYLCHILSLKTMCSQQIAISSCHFQHACTIVSVNILRTMARTLCSGSTRICFKYIHRADILKFIHTYTIYNIHIIVVQLWDRSHFFRIVHHFIAAAYFTRTHTHTRRTIPINIFNAFYFNEKGYSSLSKWIKSFNW